MPLPLQYDNQSHKSDIPVDLSGYDTMVVCFQVGMAQIDDAAELSAASIFLSGLTIFRLVQRSNLVIIRNGFKFSGFARTGFSSDEMDFALLFFYGGRIKRSLAFRILGFSLVSRTWTQLDFSGLDLFRLLIQRCKIPGGAQFFFDQNAPLPDERRICPTKGGTVAHMVTAYSL